MPSEADEHCEWVHAHPQVIDLKLIEKVFFVRDSYLIGANRNDSFEKESDEFRLIIGFLDCKSFVKK